MDLHFFSLKSPVDKTSNVWTCVCLGACVYENLYKIVLHFSAY